MTAQLLSRRTGSTLVLTLSTPTRATRWTR